MRGAPSTVTRGASSAIEVTCCSSAWRTRTPPKLRGDDRRVVIAERPARDQRRRRRRRRRGPRSLPSVSTSARPGWSGRAAHRERGAPAAAGPLEGHARPLPAGAGTRAASRPWSTSSIHESGAARRPSARREHVEALDDAERLDQHDRDGQPPPGRAPRSTSASAARAAARAERVERGARRAAAARCSAGERRRSGAGSSRRSDRAASSARSVAAPSSGSIAPDRVARPRAGSRRRRRATRARTARPTSATPSRSPPPRAATGVPMRATCATPKNTANTSARSARRAEGAPGRPRFDAGGQWRRPGPAGPRRSSVVAAGGRSNGDRGLLGGCPGGVGSGPGCGRGLVPFARRGLLGGAGGGLRRHLVGDRGGLPRRTAARPRPRGCGRSPRAWPRGGDDLRGAPPRRRAEEQEAEARAQIWRWRRAPRRIESPRGAGSPGARHERVER